MVFQRLSHTVHNSMQNPIWFSWSRARIGLVLLVFWAIALRSFATHNRAGEITYTHVEGLTYEILITTYTKSSAPADRPWLFLYWGDENNEPVDSLQRESELLLEGDIQINRYRGNHT